MLNCKLQAEKKYNQLSNKTKKEMKRKQNFEIRDLKYIKFNYRFVL